MDNIETLNVVINNDQVTITPVIEPTVLSLDDYHSQLTNRLLSLTDSQTNTKAQLDSITQSISDLQAKIALVTPVASPTI